MSDSYNTDIVYYNVYIHKVKLILKARPRRDLNPESSD